MRVYCYAYEYYCLYNYKYITSILAIDLHSPCNLVMADVEACLLSWSFAAWNSAFFFSA